VKNGTFVGNIVASEASRGTAYVSFDAHRDGDFARYIFRTTDFGKTWTPVINGLPGDDASVRGLAEFPGHPNVLFAGTEPRARPSSRCCSAFHGSTRSRTSA
jgi:hypothetical protein